MSASQIQVQALGSSMMQPVLDLLCFLNPEVAAVEVRSRLERIMAEHPHYQLYGALQDGQLIGVCGAWVATKIWCGSYLEIDNIVVHPDFRSLGVGTLMMEEMERMARDASCKILVLDSYTGNHASHRLYHRLGYEIKGFHFVKMIGEPRHTEIPA